jgi:hypothetical protein
MKPPAEPSRRSSPAEERARELASSLGWPYVELEEYAVSCGILKRIPAELCCRLRCIPLVFNRRRIVLAVDDPFHAAYLSANPQLLGSPRGSPPGGPVMFAMASPRGLDAALERRLLLVKG